MRGNEKVQRILSIYDGNKQALAEALGKSGREALDEEGVGSFLSVLAARGIVLSVNVMSLKKPRRARKPKDTSEEATPKAPRRPRKPKIVAPAESNEE